MRSRLRAPFFALATALLLTLAGLSPVLAAGDPAGTDRPKLHLVDDRGEALDAPVQVCFVRGLSTDCVDLAADRAEVDLPDLDVLRVEGAHHGPISVRSGELRADEDGIVRLKVPRKTHLTVRGAPERGLSAALFPLADPALGRPAYRFDLVRSPDERAAEVEVPAGAWILALESPGNAPDLHLLTGDRTAAPGADVTIDYRPAAGWSLLLRATAWETGEPVEGADVEVEPFTPEVPSREEGGEEERAARPAARRSRTGAGGFAVINGIDTPLADASLRHPDAVEAHADGIAGDPGDIVLREVTLEPGGTLAVAIRVDGEPRPDWTCAIQDRSNTMGRREGEEIPTIRELVTGEEGLCRAEKLPPGGYWLWATPPETADASAAVEREVKIFNNHVTRLDLDLSPIVIEGDVFRGDEPVPGYRIEVHWVGDRQSVSLLDPLASAETDDEGAYQTAVWASGVHSVQVLDPDGITADSRRVDVQGPTERVDFHLAAGNLEGVVVDLDGNPVPEIGIRAVWRTAGPEGGVFMRSTWTDEAGRFSLPIEAESGVAELAVSDNRFETQDPVVVRVEKGDVPQPVVLTVAERSLVSGRLVSASGAPVAGGWVGMYTEAGGARPTLAGHRRTAPDGTFEMSDPGDGPLRIYVTGPGCPLTSSILPRLPEEGLTLRCGPAGGTLQLRLAGPDGEPVQGEMVLLRHGGDVYPIGVLAQHLISRGLPPQSDASGRIVLPELSPGAYEVFTFDRDGQAQLLAGFLVDLQGSVAVTPGGVATMDFVLEEAPR